MTCHDEKFEKTLNTLIYQCFIDAFAYFKEKKLKQGSIPCRVAIIHRFSPKSKIYSHSENNQRFVIRIEHISCKVQAFEREAPTRNPRWISRSVW